MINVLLDSNWKHGTLWLGHSDISSRSRNRICHQTMRLFCSCQLLLKGAAYKYRLPSIKAEPSVRRKWGGSWFNYDRETYHICATIMIMCQCIPFLALWETSIILLLFLATFKVAAKHFLICGYKSFYFLIVG